MIDSTEIKGTLRAKRMTTEPEEIPRGEMGDLLQVNPDTEHLQVYPDTEHLQVYPDTELQLGTDIRRRT